MNPQVHTVEKCAPATAVVTLSHHKNVLFRGDCITGVLCIIPGSYVSF